MKQLEEVCPEMETESVLEQAVPAFHDQNKQELDFFLSVCSRVDKMQHPQSFFRLGRLFLAWAFADEAQAYFQKAIDFGINDPDICIWMSESILQQGSGEEALQTIQDCKKQYPDSLPVSRQLIWILLHMNRVSEAAKILRELFRGKTEFKEDLLLMTLVLLQKPGTGQDNSESEKIHDLLLKAFNSESSLQNRKLDSLLRQVMEGDYESAQQTLTGIMGLRKQQAYRVEDYFYLNYLYGSNGRKQVFLQYCEKEFKKMLKIKPDDVELRRTFCLLCLITARQKMKEGLDILSETSHSDTLGTTSDRDSIEKIIMATGQKIKQFF